MKLLPPVLLVLVLFIFLVLVTLGQAGERTVTLTEDQEKVLAQVARVRAQTEDVVLYDSLSGCLSTAGTETTGVIERALVRQFRKLDPPDQEVIKIDIDSKIPESRK